MEERTVHRERHGVDDQHLCLSLCLTGAPLRATEWPPPPPCMGRSSNRHEVKIWNDLIERNRQRGVKGRSMSSPLLLEYAATERERERERECLPPFESKDSQDERPTIRWCNGEKKCNMATHSLQLLGGHLPLCPASSRWPAPAPLEPRPNRLWGTGWVRCRTGPGTLGWCATEATWRYERWGSVTSGVKTGQGGGWKEGWTDIYRGRQPRKTWQGRQLRKTLEGWHNRQVQQARNAQQLGPYLMSWSLSNTMLVMESAFSSCELLTEMDRLVEVKLLSRLAGAVKLASVRRLMYVTDEAGFLTIGEGEGGDRGGGEGGWGRGVRRRGTNARWEEWKKQEGRNNAEPRQRACI